MKNLRKNTKYHGGNYYSVQSTVSIKKKGRFIRFNFLRKKENTEADSKFMVLDSYVATLQDRVNKLENGFTDVISLSQKTDYQVREDLKYETLNKLNPFTLSYIRKRFKYDFARYMGKCPYNTFMDLHVGEVLNEQTTGEKALKTLSSLTNQQLAEVIELMIETLNKRKEEVANGNA